jgi:hypothetical protein
MAAAFAADGIAMNASSYLRSATTRCPDGQPTRESTFERASGVIAIGDADGDADGDGAGEGEACVAPLLAATGVPVDVSSDMMTAAVPTQSEARALRILIRPVFASRSRCTLRTGAKARVVRRDNLGPR